MPRLRLFLRARSSTLLLGSVGIFLVSVSCKTEKSTWASAYQIETLSQGIGGPKATARPGDFVLENDRIRLAILGARNSLGPHTSGGSLIDADLQRNDPRFAQGRGLDQLAEVFPTVNLNVATIDEAVGEVAILSKGGPDEPAVICTIGPEMSFITLLDALWALQWIGERPYFHLRTDYILEPGQAAVRIRSTALFEDNPTCADSLDMSIPAETVSGDGNLPVLDLALGGEGGGGLAFGDFYLQGGSVNVFTPGVGFDEETYVQELIESGANTFTEPIRVPFLAGTADRLSYALLNDTGNIYVPMFNTSQTVAVGAGVDGDGSVGRFSSADGPFHYDRWFGIGQGDVGSAAAAVWEATGRSVGSIAGHVVEQTTGVPLSGVRVFVYESGAEAPFLEWTTDVGMDAQPDGSFAGDLPPGEYELMVHGVGRPDSERVPFKIQAGDQLSAVLESPRPGTVYFEVTDETGEPVPSKVTLFAASDTPSPRDPVLGDGFIGGNPAQVIFTADGIGEVVLPPGRYRAVASRGVEYELDWTEPFTVGDDTATNLRLQVERSVDTSGWISGDFHVHTFRSHDTGVDLHTRVITMVAEGVEYVTSTDHDAITDYGPPIADLGLQNWVRSAIGLEVTTIEVGHYMGWPLMMDHLADQGGAFDWTGLTPIEIVDQLKALGPPSGDEPLMVLAHPRDGIFGLFDQYVMNPYQEDGGDVALGTSTLNALSGNRLLEPQNFTLEFDAMEVFLGKRLEVIRTPTAPEMAAYKAGDNVDEVDILMRTLDEQFDLEEGTYTLGYGWEGVVDDWFTLNNLGYRITALGNSDTHGTTSVEAGCPRNFVMADSDQPGFVSPAAVAQAVKEGRVVASYGPFIRFYANGDERIGPGSDISGAEVELSIEVQSPGWIPIDQIELYENGRLIEVWNEEAIDNAGVVKFSERVTVTPEEDSWYVVIANGGADLSPVFTPVEFPPLFLEDIVTGALQGIGLSNFLPEAIPIPRAFPIHPYALTNPIWVDADSDGTFTPPGLPDWLVEPEAPE